MSVELIGLAFDIDQVDAMWSGKTIRAAYDTILQDEFRRKVDFRSMLYHKGQVELLSILGDLLRQGGQNDSIVDLIARRFQSGVEDSLFVDGGDLSFDYQVIRYFASLAMVDNFLVADPVLRDLLRRTGFAIKGTSVLDVEDFAGMAKSLRAVRSEDVFELQKQLEPEHAGLSLATLVQNYIEFFSYAENNHLQPILLNSSAGLTHVTDLVRRYNARNELIVEFSLAGTNRTAKRIIRSISSPAQRKAETINDRLKVKKARQSLVRGLSDPDILIRQKSVEMLGRIADVDVLPVLVQSMKDSEPEVRQEIVRAIGQIDDVSVDELLIDILANDEVPSVQLIAAFSLRERGCKKCLPVLVDLIEQRRPHMATILAYHPDLRHQRKLVARLVKMAASEYVEVRQEVSFILGRLPRAQVEDALEALTRDVDPMVQRNSLYALWDLQSSKISSGLTNIKTSSSSHCQRAHTVVSHWLSSTVNE